jgi:hypothetical protein
VSGVSLHSAQVSSAMLVLCKAVVAGKLGLQVRGINEARARVRLDASATVNAVRRASHHTTASLRLSL